MELKNGEKLEVTGWLAMAKQAYKNEEMAGVRIYARDKIVAQTRDFEQPAGYTGEFTMRSYLVGEVNAEWLDLDEGEDLIRTDRQGILWDSDYGQALQSWGANLIKEIGRISAKPRRERTRSTFIQESNIEVLARERFADSEVVEAAMDLAKQIGGFAAEDELRDKEYVDGLSDVILSVAPHKALIGAFQKFNQAISGKEVSLEELVDLFDKTRIAEMASYSQIAAERVRVIRELEKIIRDDGVNEDKFQEILADAPWLIEPTWSVISKNQSLKTFKRAFEHYWKQEKRAFEHYWKQEKGEDISLAISFENKRPDFTLVSVGHLLHIVEIKKSGYHFTDSDFERLINYVYAFRDFFERHKELSSEFSKGWRIDLIADGVDLKKIPNQESYNSVKKSDEVRRMSWNDFLTRAITAHQAFLDISESSWIPVSNG